MKTTLFILFILLTGCSKDNSGGPILSLPPETQVGANTFGCLINNKLVIPRDGEGSIMGPAKGAYFFGGYPNATDYYEIDIRDYKSYKTSKILIHLQSVHLIGIGNYQIDVSNGNNSIDGLNNNYINCRVFNKKTNSYQYYRSFENSGTCIITRYDFDNRIISGKFTAVLLNSGDLNDKISINIGRFDFNWGTLDQTYFP